MIEEFANELNYPHENIICAIRQDYTIAFAIKSLKPHKHGFDLKVAKSTLDPNLKFNVCFEENLCQITKENVISPDHFYCLPVVFESFDNSGQMYRFYYHCYQVEEESNTSFSAFKAVLKDPHLKSQKVTIFRKKDPAEDFYEIFERTSGKCRFKTVEEYTYLYNSRVETLRKTLDKYNTPQIEIVQVNNFNNVLVSSAGLSFWSKEPTARIQHFSF